MLSNTNRTFGLISGLCGIAVGAIWWGGWIQHGSTHELNKLLHVTNATVCVILSDDVYDTRQVSKLDAYSLITAGLALREACDCPTLCYEYPYFQRAGLRCKCLETTRPKMENPVSFQRELLPSNFFDGDDLSTCSVTATGNECSVSQRCLPGQICTNNGRVPALCTCEPVKCANRYGNPCGPGSVCRDTPLGYNCTKLVGLTGCPSGCGPNSTCTATIVASGQTEFKCLCDPGFARNQPYLGCEVVPAPVPAPVSPPKSVPVPAPVSPPQSASAPRSAPVSPPQSASAPRSAPVLGPVTGPVFATVSAPAAPRPPRAPVPPIPTPAPKNLVLTPPTPAPKAPKGLVGPPPVPTPAPKITPIP